MDRYEVLLQQNKRTFHASDLALFWNIDNKSTLNMTLKRYVDRNVLKRIHKGFYSTIEAEKIDPFDLGFSYINTYGYLSLETVLAKAGLIFQDVKYITFVSSKSVIFEIAGNKYKSRQLKSSFLYNSEGIKQVNGHFEANVERAVADMLYFNPRYHFDNLDSVDFNAVKLIQKEIGYVKS